MRSLPHHAHFLASTILFQHIHGNRWQGGGRDPDGNDVRLDHKSDTNKTKTVKAFAQEVSRKISMEKELVIDPSYFVKSFTEGRFRDCGRLKVRATIPCHDTPLCNGVPCIDTD